MGESGHHVGRCWFHHLVQSLRSCAVDLPAPAAAAAVVVGVVVVGPVLELPCITTHNSTDSLLMYLHGTQG